MHITRCLHIAQDVLLKFGNGRQRVRDILVLLNVSDDFCGFGPFGKVDQCCLLDNGGYTVLNERKIGKINT